MVQDRTVNMTGGDVMKRISNTQTSRSYAKREEHQRINTLLDQALEMTFPCSDPIAITINGIYDLFRSETAGDPGGKREQPSVPKERGRA